MNIRSLNENDEKYRKLLKKQIYWLNRNNEKVYGRAEKLYQNYLNNTLPKNIKDRCCNFKLLENICKKFNSIK